VRSWKIYIAERQYAKHMEHAWLFSRWSGSVGREHKFVLFWIFEKRWAQNARHASTSSYILEM
jgi:hypothetical protein